MNKIYSSLINIILFSVFLLFWISAYAIAAGFLEITFKWRFENLWGAIIGISLSLSTAAVLYFYLPIKRYRSTAGKCFVNRIRGEESGLKPLAFYGSLIGIMLIAYFLTWGVSGLIFSPIVKKQEKVLESVGMSFDWKSYYPKWDSTDNAAPYLKQAGDSLGASSDEISKLWELLGKENYDMAVVSKDIDRLMQNSQKSIASLDGALKFHKLIWHDYSDFQDKDIFNIPMFPFLLQRLVDILMLDAINSAYRDDWSALERAISRAVGIVNLQKQDPTLIGSLTTIRSIRIIYDGLAVIVRVSPDKSEGLSIIKRTIDKLPNASGVIKKGLELENSQLAAQQKEISRNFSLFLSAYAAASPSIGEIIYGHIFNIFYTLWWQWDRYILLRNAEFQLKAASPSNNLEIINKTQKEFSDFFDSHCPSISAMISCVASPTYIGYSRKEWEIQIKQDALLLFASSVDYRRKYGKYPDTLDSMMPEYFTEFPKNPANKDYLYRTSGDSMEVYAEGFDDKHTRYTINNWRRENKVEGNGLHNNL